MCVYREEACNQRWLQLRLSLFHSQTDFYPVLYKYCVQVCTVMLFAHLDWKQKAPKGMYFMKCCRSRFRRQTSELTIKNTAVSFVMLYLHAMTHLNLQPYVRQCLFDIEQLTPSHVKVASVQ